MRGFLKMRLNYFKMVVPLEKKNNDTGRKKRFVRHEDGCTWFEIVCVWVLTTKCDHLLDLLRCAVKLRERTGFKDIGSCQSRDVS